MLVFIVEFSSFLFVNVTLQVKKKPQKRFWHLLILFKSTRLQLRFPPPLIFSYIQQFTNNKWRT